MSEIATVAEDTLDVEEAAKLLLRDLRTGEHGLTSSEAQRRLVQYGPNELTRRGGLRWPTELARQLTHPLALLCGSRRRCRSLSAASPSRSPCCS